MTGEGSDKKMAEGWKPGQNYRGHVREKTHSSELPVEQP